MMLNAVSVLLSDGQNTGYSIGWPVVLKNMDVSVAGTTSRFESRQTLVQIFRTTPTANNYKLAHTEARVTV